MFQKTTELSYAGLKWLLLMALVFTATFSALFSPFAWSVITATKDMKTITTINTRTFVDTRSLESCVEKSVREAYCLHDSQLSYPDGTLASFRDINWLVGTYGLDSSSTVIVFGNDIMSNYFVAGVLHLLGQHHVVVWKGEPEQLMQTTETGAGRTRGVLRSRYFTAPMREDRISLDTDVYDFFTSENISIMDYSESFKGERALLYQNEDSNSYLLLARNPREAIAHFALQSEQNPEMGINVHIDGLQQRTAQSFGAPFSSLPRAQYLLLIGFALLILTSLFIYRHKAACLTAFR